MSESLTTNSTTPTAPTTSTYLMIPSVSRLRKKPQLYKDENVFTIDADLSPFDTGSLYSAPSLLSLHSTVEGGSSRHEEKSEVGYTELYNRLLRWKTLNMQEVGILCF